MKLQDQVDALVAMQGTRPHEDDLLLAGVEDYEPVDVSGVNSTFRVVLDSGTVAFHKPFSGADALAAMSFGHAADQVAINECAAWRLASALGEPYSEIVAVCVLRTVEGEAGSLSGLVAGSPAHYHDAADVFSRAPAQCAAAGFYDALIAQQDRHGGNAFWNPTTERLGLIDHGYTFALSGDYLNAADFLVGRHTVGPLLTCDERDTLARLLDGNDLLGLSSVLLADRASALRARAEAMLGLGSVLAPGRF